jgi:hypothetical protein
MQRELDGFDNRRLRLVTRHGQVEGQLRTNSNVSTLHYLNVAAMSRDFIVIQPPIESSTGWSVGDGDLALSIDAVIFAQEVSEYTPVPGDPVAAAEYERRAIRLNIHEYAVEGLLHLPPGANPIARLNQDRHAFFALSSVSVAGPDVRFAAPFLAIKRSEVIAVQAIGHEAELDRAVESEFSTIG